MSENETHPTEEIDDALRQRVDEALASLEPHDDPADEIRIGAPVEVTPPPEFFETESFVPGGDEDDEAPWVEVPRGRGIPFATILASLGAVGCAAVLALVALTAGGGRSEATPGLTVPEQRRLKEVDTPTPRPTRTPTPRATGPVTPTPTPLIDASTQIVGPPRGPIIEEDDDEPFIPPPPPPRATSTPSLTPGTGTPRPSVTGTVTTTRTPGGSTTPTTLTPTTPGGTVTPPAGSPTPAATTPTPFPPTATEARSTPTALPSITPVQ